MAGGFENLIKQAAHYAEWCLRNGGQIPPTAMAINADGFLLMVPPKIGTEKDKDQFANAARLLAIGYEVEAVCMILESWAVIATRPGQNIGSCPPSESPDRVEVVAISGESRGDSLQRILKIQRDGCGKFTSFATLSESSGMQGRFAEILPPKMPNEAQIKMARFAISGMGYVVEGRGNDPIWN